MNPTRAHPAHPGTAEARLGKWGAVIDGIAADVEQAGNGLANDFRTSVRDVKLRHVEAQAELASFSAAGGERWRTFKNSVAGAWNTFEVALLKLTAKERQIPGA